MAMPWPGDFSYDPKKTVYAPDERFDTVTAYQMTARIGPGFAAANTTEMLWRMILDFYFPSTQGYALCWTRGNGLYMGYHIRTVQCGQVLPERPRWVLDIKVVNMANAHPSDYMDMSEVIASRHRMDPETRPDELPAIISMGSRTLLKDARGRVIGGRELDLMDGDDVAAVHEALVKLKTDALED